MYSFARKLLFALDPELSHELSLDMIGAAKRLHLLQPFAKPRIEDRVKVFGLDFPNRVGLAAGLDKNGDYFNALADFGFGFVEIGTVTPRSQPGNPKPRLFRLTEDEAIINRMGFNNKGVHYLADRAKKRNFDGLLGINIGKNKDTREDDALNDYLQCLHAVYHLADYVTINISSPNTPGLRNLQFGKGLTRLLSGLKAAQETLSDRKQHYVPLLVKVSPDNDAEQTKQLAEALLKHRMDGLIVSNTTVSRNGLREKQYSNEAGGLSGRPLAEKSTAAIAEFYRLCGDSLPIIGVGGIFSAADAAEKIQAGAKLVQLYTGFIYRGPALVHEVAAALAATPH